MFPNKFLKNVRRNYSFKMLLGETAVGKSSLINRFVSNTFKNDFKSTMVGYCSSKEINFEKYDRKINFEIWDTAGQEKYRALAKIFYQDSKVTLLVYDITRKDSFEALKNYWYKEVRDNSSQDVVLVLLGNKSDLYEYEEVTEEQAEEFAKSINAIYQQTSAANGSGVKELFNMIGNKILNPNYKDVYDKMKLLNNPIKIKKDVSQNDDNFGIDNSNNDGQKKSKKKNCC